MTILYSNGCSYTANRVLPNEQLYPYLLADKLKWSLEFAATPGSSNSKILRCTIRDCIKLLEKKEKIVAMIQLSHMTRTEFAGVKNTVNHWKYSKDDLFESINGPDCPDISEIARQFGKNYILLHDEQAALTRLMSDIIALAGFFNQHSIDYVIYSGPKIYLTLDKIGKDIFYQYLKNDTRVLDLINFNMLELTGKQVHPDTNGMQLIADYFFNLLYESA